VKHNFKEGSGNIIKNRGYCKEQEDNISKKNRRFLKKKYTLLQRMKRQYFRKQVDTLHVKMLMLFTIKYNSFLY
jgi:hypothetical protein